MDIISGLSDEVLVKILSFVPTKVAVSTCILSKRWKFLWMWLPKLKYTGNSGYSGSDESLSSLRDFINKNLPLHRAPVIESLHLDLRESRDPLIKPEDMKLWIEIAVSRYVRELEIKHHSTNNSENIFPSSLFTCSSLMNLTLKSMTLMKVPSMVCLPSLKSLKLDYVKYGDNERLQELLSICPVLEDLNVCFCEYDTIQGFTVIAPSLRKLSLDVSISCDFLEGYEIDTPSLEYLKLKDWSDCSSLVKDMPKLREAHVDLVSYIPKCVIGAITSVERLTICSEAVIVGDLVFDQLKHLELCICKDNSPNLLVQMLKNSPNLRVLNLSETDDHGDLKSEDMFSWNHPSFVPECFLSSLQLLKWDPYFGRPQDRDMAFYVLKNARQLKAAIIVGYEHVDFDVSILEMIKVLALSSRASSTCELVFID